MPPRLLARARPSSASAGSNTLPIPARLTCGQSTIYGDRQSPLPSLSSPSAGFLATRERAQSISQRERVQFSRKRGTFLTTSAYSVLL